MSLISSMTYQVLYAGICGSDLQKITPSSTLADIHKLGHEVVVKTPEGVGVINPMINCKKCMSCVAKSEMFCENLEAVGRTIDGAFSGTVAIPASNVIPIHFSLQHLGVLADPLAVVLHGMKKLKKPQNILIIGDGTIAQLSMISFALSDMPVVSCTLITKSVERAIDIRSQYNLFLKQSKCKINVSHIVQPDSSYDTVIECVGRNQPDTLNIAIKHVANSGTILSFGVYPVGFKADLNIRALLYKEAKLIGSNSYNHADLLLATELISTNETVYAQLIGQIYTDMKEALASARSKTRTPKKIVVAFGVKV